MAANPASSSPSLLALTTAICCPSEVAAKGLHHDQDARARPAYVERARATEAHMTDDERPAR
jgi:hypothetical protein